MTLAWILGIVGVLGIGGMIALAIFAPALLLVIWKLVADTVGWILSTRVGCAALAVLAGLIIGDIYGDLHGRAIEKAVCAEAQAQAERDARKRDDRQGELAGTDDKTRIAALEAENERAQEKLNDYEKKLRDRASAACPLTPDDLPGGD